MIIEEVLTIEQRDKLLEEMSRQEIGNDPLNRDLTIEDN